MAPCPRLYSNIRRAGRSCACAARGSRLPRHRNGGLQAARGCPPRPLLSSRTPVRSRGCRAVWSRVGHGQEIRGGQTQHRSSKILGMMAPGGRRPCAGKTHPLLLSRGLGEEQPATGFFDKMGLTFKRTKRHRFPFAFVQVSVATKGPPPQRGEALPCARAAWPPPRCALLYCARGPAACRSRHVAATRGAVGVAVTQGARPHSAASQLRSGTVRAS